MRKYLKRLVLFVLPLVALLAALEYGLRSIPNNYAYARDYILEHGDSIEVLILGNSHAFNGIDPFGFAAPAFNASAVAQDHKRDLALFERYIDELPALKHVIVPVSYFTIGAMIEDGPEPWRIRNYVIYHDLPEQASMPEHWLELSRNRKLESILMIPRYLLHDSTRIQGRSRGGSPGKHKAGLDFSSAGIETAKRHTIASTERYRENRGYLERLVQLAGERGIHVHLFNPPGHQAYREAMNAEQLAIAKACGRELATAHKHVTYHDLLDDERFQEADFSDSDHLQSSGTLKLTRILSADLAEHEKR